MKTIIKELLEIQKSERDRGKIKEVNERVIMCREYLNGLAK